MSSLAERLRGIVKPGTPVVPAPAPEAAENVAETLAGQWAESRGQRYLVVDRSYGPGHRHGRVAIMDALPPWSRLRLLGGCEAQGKLLFVDVETTGLAGGAGTYAFLVGCGWFDGPTFRIRQFFLSTFGAEAALLDGVAGLADEVAGVVTFNGKSFDLPLIETRFLFHRMENPFAGVPHIDMLHPARRLWRAEESEAVGIRSSCRLDSLEQTLCGVEREGDVAGFEIPARYFQYVRRGDARPLVRVLEHNRLDIVSLALLTARASQLLEEGAAHARTAREALGLGSLYERGELSDLARQAYARATELPGDAMTRAEAFRSLAVICRRQRHFVDAANAWRNLLDVRRCPPHIVREATEALAIHHEHRLRDPHNARDFALQSLRLQSSASRQRAVEHRLARLDRKLAAGLPLPLFPLFAEQPTC